jgi:hypothetical protein
MGVVKGTPGLADSMARATRSTPAATVPEVHEKATTSMRPPGSRRAVARARSSTIQESVAITTGFSKATRLATTDTGWPESISAKAASLTWSVAGTTRPMRGLSGLAGDSIERLRMRIVSPYRIVRPPSTGSATPVMKAASSEARKSIARATSSGVPGRPSGQTSFHAAIAASTS